MAKTILGIKLENRFQEVPEVQRLLTEHGCIIKTRIGLHQQVETNDPCSEKGLILLELNDGRDPEVRELEQKLGSIEGVQVRKMEFV